MLNNTLQLFVDIVEDKTLSGRYIQFFIDSVNFSRITDALYIKYLKRKKSFIWCHFGGANNNFGAQNPYVPDDELFLMQNISLNFGKKSSSLKV